jgi:hypothetical protein
MWIMTGLAEHLDRLEQQGWGDRQANRPQDGVPGVIDGKFTLGFLSPQDNVKLQGVEIPSQDELTTDDATRYGSD